ncbi:MAG: hypothetical protein PHV39_06000 [Methanomicrobium sp.]|nr:hypothetical protein [Methanomicrobium sp.]
MKKSRALIIFIILTAVFLLIFSHYTQNTELFTPKNIPGTDDNFNPDALKQISQEKSEETLSMMQDFIDLSGTIILNIRYERLDDALDDIEEYKKILGKYDNLVINLDMTKSEIEEFRRNNKEQLKNLEMLTNQTKNLDYLEKLQIKYRDSNDPGKYYSVTYDISRLREEIEKTREALKESTDKTIESANKYEIHTQNLKDSKTEIENIGTEKPTEITESQTVKPTDGITESQTVKPTEITESQIVKPTEITESQTVKPTDGITGTQAGSSDSKEIRPETGPLKYINSLIQKVMYLFVNDKEKTGDEPDSLLLPAIIILTFILLSVSGYRHYKSRIRHGKKIENYAYSLKSDAGDFEKERDTYNIAINEYCRLISAGRACDGYKLLAYFLFSLVSSKEKVSYNKSVTNNEFISKLSLTEKNRLMPFAELYEKVVYSGSAAEIDKQNLFEMFKNTIALYSGDER